MPLNISKDVLIENLIDKYPSSVKFLSVKGIKCIACGEPIWGTLEQAATEKGFTSKQVDELILELKMDLNKK